MKSTDIAYKGLIDRLKNVRKETGINQLELAKRIGRPQSYVSRVEAMQLELSLVEFIRWARGLGLDPTEEFVHLAEAVPRKRRQVVD